MDRESHGREVKASLSGGGHKPWERDVAWLCRRNQTHNLTSGLDIIEDLMYGECNAPGGIKHITCPQDMALLRTLCMDNPEKLAT